LSNIFGLLLIADLIACAEMLLKDASPEVCAYAVRKFGVANSFRFAMSSFGPSGSNVKK